VDLDASAFARRRDELNRAVYFEPADDGRMNRMPPRETMKFVKPFAHW
jgi:hypothetical protein